MQIPSNQPNERTSVRLLVLFCLLISFLFVLASQQVYAGFAGPVVAVLDGDTIEVLHNQTP